MQDTLTTITPPRPRLKRQKLLQEILETVLLVIAIYSVVDLASVRFYVDGPSMEPSFHTGERVIVSRVSYLIEEPQRGEIIVFKSQVRPEDDPPLIKRLIGLPGETVEIRDTRVYVNGRELDETYINEPCSTSRCRDKTWELGPNEYFVMGDNRNHSNDSRSFGPVPREHIIGEALIRYWAPEKWAILDKYRFPENPFLQ